MSSDSVATGSGTGTSDAAATAAVAAAEAATANCSANPTANSLLLAGNDIWIELILPSVGIGQYTFVGAVNKKMNQLYKEYCEIELKKNPTRVIVDGGWFPPTSRAAEITDTFYGETFCNQPRTEYWFRDNSDHKKPRHRQVCQKIAKVGNIMVMQWALQQGFPWEKRTCAAAAQMVIWNCSNG
ncbi:expressed unknown protein [Seminavis robusta]|uniref:Uncharacterized protein n=1 Tax=Seminavis robusta TaxID=568900 RepID=A0A9N8DH57_9STRA|nr:expressed unknown protein [Seminavis robusta]|eukprot:Sro86_g045710.1 n/a (184) ;mRNA; r:49315-49866